MSKRPTRHAVADHALGALFDHVHAPGDEHDHDHDHMDGLLADGTPDDVVLTSIGIDIGSSGTQVAFSRLAMERSLAGEVHGPAARPQTKRRETLYQSPVFLTPFAADGGIDAARVQHILDQSFAAAGLDPDHVDCGVVILTGAARERSNAEAIARGLAETCGDLVSASAGHHLEEL